MNKNKKCNTHKSNTRKNYFFCVVIFLAELAGLTAHQATAAETFNPDFLQNGEGGPTISDLSAFENNHSQLPGNYFVDIWLNNKFMESKTIAFIASNEPEGGSSLVPCIKLDMLVSYGIRAKAFPDLKETNHCINIEAIPQASATFNFNTQRLLLSIPQAALHASARGYVSPDRFDEGINAFLLGYRFTGANNSERGDNASNSNSQYLNLRPGLNIGAWRVRNYTTWSRNSSSSEKNKWDSVYTYAQRNIVPLKSQLVLGDSSSPSYLFESVPFRGIQLASDDEMLPESLRGYAPVVRGTARTNAQVIVRQNGYIIYQDYVAPGTFEINDLYATGGSGDLFVTIKEADGSEQYLVVPYAALPMLVREGYLKYSFTSGQYRTYEKSVEKQNFTQATAIYGLPWNISMFGGFQAASHYQSLAIGAGKNFGGLGALSTDLINSWSTPKNDVKQTGQSLRARYNKNFYETGTDFSFASYRYSTHDYYSLPELLDTYRYDLRPSWREQTRHRTELIMNQSLGDFAGSLSLSLLRENYWKTDRRMESFTIGYNNSYHSVRYNLNYSYSRNTTNLSDGARYNHDRIFSFNASVPLDRWLAHTWANYTVTTSKPGNTNNSIGLNGTTLEDNNLYWNIQEGYGSQGKGNSGNLDGRYRGTYGEVSAGYGYDKTARRVNYGVDGGLLVHKDGVTLGQSFGDTIVLVKAPGASGTGIINNTGVKTDFRGYTVIPYATPYREYDITLDPGSLPEDADLDLATQIVVPTRGAVVRATFSPQVGARGIMTLSYNGKPVPFGAIVIDADANEKHAQGNIVGDEGQVYLNGLKPEGSLLVKWGDTNRQCRVNYSLSGSSTENGIHILNGICQ